MHLSVPLRARLKRYHETLPSPRRSYSNIILDAIEAAARAGRLAELLGRPAPRTGELFVGRAPKIDRHDDDQVQVTLRLSDVDRETIETLIEEYGATSRSALVAACLVAYLDEVFPPHMDKGHNDGRNRGD